MIIWMFKVNDIFAILLFSCTLDPLRPPIHAVQLTSLMTQLTLSSVSEEMAGMYACTAGPLTSLYPLNIPRKMIILSRGVVV